MNLSYYHFKYSHSDYFPCRNDSDCCQNDYCRCAQIVDPRVTEVPCEFVLGEIKNCIYPVSNKRAEKKLNHAWTPIENYCMGRLFTTRKLYDPTKYELHTCSGYYGEELSSVSVDVDDFIAEAKEMLALSDDDKIRFVLNAEYGYLLPEVEIAHFKVRKVDQVAILRPSEYRKCEGPSETFGAPIGIYYEVSPGVYRIIDGFHRWFASKDSEKVEIIVAHA